MLNLDGAFSEAFSHLLNPQISQTKKTVSTLYRVFQIPKSSMNGYFISLLKRTPNPFLFFLWANFLVIRRTFSYPQRQHKWNSHIHLFMPCIIRQRDLIKIAHKHFYLFLLDFETTIPLKKYNQQSGACKKAYQKQTKKYYFIFLWI